MAPWPEQGNEPKAPDKLSESDKCSENKCTPSKLINRADSSEGDAGIVNAKTNDTQIEEKDPCVLSLDECQLKALLDEAISYKNPIDREGKSDLFKELLQEAEADDKEDSRGGGGGVGGGVGIGSHSAQTSHYHNNYRRNNRNHRRDGATVSERQLRGGSLQNIHAFSYELDGGRKRGKNRRSDGNIVNVSARQREGGSLPNNVDHVPQPDHLATAAALMLGDLHPLLPISLSRQKEMPIASDTLSSTTDYVVLDVNSSTTSDADVSLVNKQKNSTDDSSCGIEMQIFNSDRPESVYNYTSRATLEIGGVYSDNNSYQDHKTKSNSSVAEEPNEVDLSVVFPLTKSYGLVNGTDIAPVQLLSSSNPLKSIVANDKGSSEESVKPSFETGAYSFPMQHVSVLAIPPHQLLVGSDKATPIKDTDLRMQNKNGDVISEKSVQQKSNLSQYPFEHSSIFSIHHAFNSVAVVEFHDVNRLVPNKDSSSFRSKPFDENGNSVGASVSVYRDSISERKKARRTKIKNDHKDTILAENIEGHRGDRDINSLLKYIEAGGEGKHGNKNTKLSNGAICKRSNKVKASREKSTDGETMIRGGKTKRAKEKLKKSNSLEEISKTKLEDLTHESSSKAMPKKQTTLDDEELGERRILPEDDTSFTTASADECSSSLSNKRREFKQERSMENLAQDSEFHVVTKKQRRKKRRSISNDRNTRGKTEQPRRNVGSFPPHDGSNPFPSRSRQISPDKRRKSTSSMPPSDKSDCSDLDSVHSLPVSSTTPKCQVQKTSTSSGSTPQASYADIARSTISPPQVLSNNISGRWPTVHKSISSSPPSLMSAPSLSSSFAVSSNGKSKKPHTAPSSVTSSSAHEDSLTHLSSPDLVPTVTLPLKHKKDAMTSTSCDLSKLEPIFNNVNGTDSGVPSVNIVNNKHTSAVSQSKPCSSNNDVDSGNDLFVEFTLKQSNSDQFEQSSPVTEVSVEETVVLKSPPKCNCETVSGSLTILIPSKNQKENKHTSWSSSSSLPPVILLDEELNHNNSLIDSDVTFGFEVNEELLRDSVSPPTTVLSYTSESDCSVTACLAQQPILANITYNYQDTVIFIEKAWEDVQRDLLASKTSTNKNKIQYFSSNQ